MPILQFWTFSFYMAYAAVPNIIPDDTLNWDVTRKTARGMEHDIDARLLAYSHLASRGPTDQRSQAEFDITDLLKQVYHYD